MDGYNVSGYARKIGPLTTEYDTVDLTALSDAIKGGLPGTGHLTTGALNGVLDPTATTGLHAIASAPAGTKRLVTVAIGMRAAPTMGDPCFTAQMSQLGYGAEDDGGAVTVSVPLGEYSADATTLLYSRGWGVILDPGSTARTDVNGSTGVDDLIAPAVTSTRGGYMVYHVLASNAAGATGVIKTQDSDTNVSGDFDDLASTGVITVTAGVSGIVALAPTATVRQFLRHQLVFTTMTSITALIGFVRG